jgi:MazG family protein
VPELERLLAIMARLRDPEQGCPWDREQTFASIAPYTVEEAYEVAEAIQHGDSAALRDELGDLLFQVVFHARLAEEAGLFAFADVARAIADKLVRRHPHVFLGARVESAQALRQAWEAHKAAERQGRLPPGGRASQVDGVSVALPALVRAAKLQKRAAGVGFDWPDADGVLDKVAEELAELRAARAASESPARQEAELGDLLFSCVNLARHLGIDPETALRQANTRFEARFRRMEDLLAEHGREPPAASLAEMDAAWEQAKSEERPAAQSPDSPAFGGAGPASGRSSKPSSSNGSGGGLPS